MPIKVQNDLPARAILETENIFMMDENRALSQDIRPLQIVILNLMPVKEDTETQLLRALSNTPIQLDITFLHMSSHESTHTSVSHLNKFYVTFDAIRKQKFDGMIITGAPVEQMEFEDVDYWEELTKIMKWTNTHVTSTVHICWGAQAGLYYHYGIQKHEMEKKLFGIFEQRVLDRTVPLVRGFDDVFRAPHSRYTYVKKEDIEACPELKILAESDEAGVFLVQSLDGKRIFVMGHPEYDRVTLDGEYRRDRGKGMDTAIPKNYYPDDDPEKRPMLTWRMHANALYNNWINFYVYQVTPYLLEESETDV
ncbi:homoserine O-acetyltransferase MetA [Fusibacillus kribbianus]|uniref:Homoserine O-acetyltransferase n=1 Tax=Fusibacillus kribbianus TaxID=3044208 RepID=A0AAP4BBV1_9FIRM|nr:homoserine O-succinyltransferase [Ruminococcus sp. YH-rum2234]MDI9242318.1 homoserine O-succinyltransferase [Ruminococcus sp. YH-rum2234]